MSDLVSKVWVQLPTISHCMLLSRSSTRVIRSWPNDADLWLSRVTYLVENNVGLSHQWAPGSALGSLLCRGDIWCIDSELHCCVQALWLPGSQTEVAVVTADFVKVYNLSVDAISPQYYFLLPTGKIRDATFVVSDNERHLVLMASSGYIYTQVMDVTSSAQHGPFYITNILEMKHGDVKVSRLLV